MSAHCPASPPPPVPGWRLRTSSASPFGRKVRMALAAIDRLHDTEIVAADTSDPLDSLRQENPLGKIPVLLHADVAPLFDSRVIVEYLNEIDGRHILIPSGGARYEVLREQALADGLLDAAVLQVYEKRFRPEEKRYEHWVAYQRAKTDRALDAFAAQPPAPFDDRPHIGAITLAAALGYLDFRFDGLWRQDYPRLVEWLDAFAAHFPAYEATCP